MPEFEPGPNPRELELQKIDGLIEKYLKIEDEGVPPTSLNLVLAAGEQQAMPTDAESKPDEKYLAFKAGDTSQIIDNLWTIFSSATKNRLNKMLRTLREVGADKPQAAEAVIDEYYYREAPLYYLSQRGYLRRALEQLGPQKSERFLQTNSELDAMTDLFEPETIRKMSTPEFRAQKTEHDQTAKELYVILHELGVDSAKLDT